jgi:hypothetical protein
MQTAGGKQIGAETVGVKEKEATKAGKQIPVHFIPADSGTKPTPIEGSKSNISRASLSECNPRG